MKNIIFLFLFSITTLLFGNQIGFEQNIGQIEDQNNTINHSVLYSLKLENFNINLKKGGFSYDFYENENQKFKTHRLDFKFKGYNKDYTIEYHDKINYYENFISNSKDFIIPFFQKITYKNFYSNIDLEFYVNENNDKPFEYNFVLHSGADINNIQFQVEGADTNLESNQLKFKLRFGELIESLPKSWIQNTNSTQEVKIEYCYHQGGNIGLQSHQNIKNKKVIIDPLPIRKWGTYLSNYTFNGYPTDIHNIDLVRVKFLNTDIYACGSTTQKNLATSGAFQTTTVIQNNINQPIIVKFNNQGERIWLTYFGTKAGQEHAVTLDTDNEGNIYVGSNIIGDNFATNGAYQTRIGNNHDMHLAKLDASGRRIWASYYGGNSIDKLRSLKVDKDSEAIYIGGHTMSTDLIHPSNAIVSTINDNGYGGLIAKFNLDGEYLYSSYTYGEIERFDINREHIIIVEYHNEEHHRNSPQFENTTGGYFLTKYDKNLNQIWSRQFLNNEPGDISQIKFDSDQNIVLSGMTYGADGIAYGNAYSPNFDVGSYYVSYGGFLKKFNSDGFDLFGTYIGKEGISSVHDLIIGDNNEIIIAGYSSSDSKIIYGGNNHFQSNSNNRNSININGNSLLMKFDPLGNPIWGFLNGDYSYGHRYNSLDYNTETKEIITVGWNYSPYMTSTPHAFQTKPMYENGRFIGLSNATVNLYLDIENNFKIEKTGDECDINTLVYTASGAVNYTWYDYDDNIISHEASFIPTTTGQYTCKFDDGINIGYISIIVNEVNLTTPPTPSLN